MYFNFSKALFLTLFLLVGQYAKAQEKELELYFEQNGQIISLLADNTKLYPQSVTVSIDLKGLKPLREIPDIMVIPADTNAFELAQLSIPEGRSWSYKYSYKYFVGDANA